ncbi:toxin-antitoxin system toxin subunit [Wenjunlia vitaminophila]|uniref:Toxin-antitoxin system toxin subunit n=1 Tax=Wenjunlia vitaminophila TaxID=76728 RepID=A0A0T6LR57_WENVI|nr:DUF397 domain-containing protein [Wenjunlia vitaminophila]KRV48534.1 toxin-antitoxin system toxin subunit [Wenjunlia vitaminophila]
MTRTLAISETAWVKSSYSSGDEGECVEFAPGHALVTGMVPVRDSKDPAGPALAFSAAAWSAFTAAVRRGEFPGV